METESLPPIPTPPGQRWREFRIRVLPFFVFVCALAAMLFMWTNFVQPVAIVGLVETNSVNITTTQAGLLTVLAVNRFDEVTNGQVLAEVAPYDQEQIQAQLSAIESGVGLVRARMDLNELGNQDSAAQLRLNLYVEQTLLGIAKVKLEEANVVLDRDKVLLQGNAVISQAKFDIDSAAVKSLASEVSSRGRLVEEWAKQLAQMEPMRTNVYSQMDKATKEEIQRQQEQLRQLQKPIVLRSPIKGKVSGLPRHAGERVPSGAVILTITSGQAERITAYVRQPLNFHPKVGDLVKVRTRTIRRRISDAQIIKVGTQLEPVSPMLLPMDRPRPELGLPIALTLPPELNLLPGEIVDIKVSKN